MHVAYVDESMPNTSAGFKLTLALSKAWFSIVLNQPKKDKLKEIIYYTYR